MRGKKNPVNFYAAKCIRRLRMERRMRVADLAAAAGIPLGSYSCLETGRYRLSLENLFRVACALGVPAAKLLPPTLPMPADGGPCSDEWIAAAVRLTSADLPRLAAPRDVARAVCKVFGVRLADLAGTSRHRNLCEARTVAAVLAAERFDVTLAGLAKEINRDVSSLSHALRRLGERRGEKQFVARLQESRRALVQELAAKAKAARRAHGPAISC